jgi:hypothetical protein
MMSTGKAATVGVIGPIPMPPPPEVAPVNGPAVTFTATLPYTADKFTKDVETKYKAAVAAAAGTAAANVDIAAKFTRRQAGSATVETTVRAKDAAGQTALSSALGTGDALKNKLNAQLKARGVAESTGVTPVAAKGSATAVVDAPKSSAPAIRSFGMSSAVASGAFPCVYATRMYKTSSNFKLGHSRYGLSCIIGTRTTRYSGNVLCCF